MNEKRRCQQAILPAVIYTILEDAINLNKETAACKEIKTIQEIAAKIISSYIDNIKLIKRIGRGRDKILKLFLDKNEGTYYIRKVILGLFEVTQLALDQGLIDENAALVVQDVLNLENEVPMNDEEWLKLKASADKRTEEILTIIREI